ncbi:MAG: hypothetical protein ACXAEU_25840 [Candidatus Hodarchaeales archaeon]
MQETKGSKNINKNRYTVTGVVIGFISMFMISKFTEITITELHKTLILLALILLAIFFAGLIFQLIIKFLNGKWKSIHQ